MISIYNKLFRTDTKHQKIKRILIKNSNATFIIRIGGSFLSFLLQILLARILGVKNYGDYIYVITLINILHIFGKLGFDRSSLRFIPSYQINKKWSLAKGFLLQSNKIVSVSSISISILSLLIIWILQNSIRSELVNLLYLASFLLALKSFSVIIYAKIQALKHVVLSQTLHLILQPMLLGIIFLIYVLIIQSYTNAKIALIINIISTIIVMTFAIWCLRYSLPNELSNIEPSFDTYTWIKISLILSLITGFNIIIQETDVLMIGIIQSTSESGIYAAAQRISRLLRFGLIAINAVVAPLIAESYAANQLDQLQYISTLATRRMSAFAILACLIIIFWGDKILSLFGSDFQSAYPVLIILAFGQIVNSFTGPVGLVMTMTDNQTFSLYLTIFSAFLNVLLNYIFIKLYGIIGAAIATSITLSFWNMAQAFVVRRRLGVNTILFANRQRS